MTTGFVLLVFGLSFFLIACASSLLEISRLKEENRKAIKVAGPTVWLSAEPEELYKRISDDPATVEDRPNLTADGGFQEICNVLEERTPIYEQCADAKIQTDNKTPRQVVDEIVERLDLSSQLNAI